MSRDSLYSPRVLLPTLLLTLAIIACGSSSPVAPTVDPNITPTLGISRFLTTDLDEFIEVLSQALADRDFDTFPTLMKNPFDLLVFRAGGSQRSPTVAAEQIERSLYPPEGMDIECGGSPPDASLVALAMNMTQYLDQAPGVVFCTGWGPEGIGEATLIVEYDNDGYLYWTEITVALNGFAGAIR